MAVLCTAHHLLHLLPRRPADPGRRRWPLLIWRSQRRLARRGGARSWASPASSSSRATDSPRPMSSRAESISDYEEDGSAAAGSTPGRPPGGCSSTTRLYGVGPNNLRRSSSGATRPSRTASGCRTTSYLQLLAECGLPAPAAVPRALCGWSWWTSGGCAAWRACPGPRSTPACCRSRSSPTASGSMFLELGLPGADLPAHGPVRRAWRWWPGLRPRPAEAAAAPAPDRADLPWWKRPAAGACLRACLRAWGGPPDMCGIAGLFLYGDPRAGAARETLAQMVAPLAPPRAGRRRACTCRAAGPGARAPVDHRPRRRAPADLQRGRHGGRSSATARSTTTASCAASWRRAATGSAPAPTPR